MTNVLQYFLLSPNVERIFAGEQSGPGGGADLLTVGLVQPHTPLGQSLHGGGGHVRVVPGHVVPPWWLEVETLLHGLTPYLNHLLR